MSFVDELGRSRVRDVRESSGRLPPSAKYWFPREGMVAVSAFRFLGKFDKTVNSKQPRIIILLTQIQQNHTIHENPLSNY